jgi:HSP20 family protein
MAAASGRGNMEAERRGSMTTIVRWAPFREFDVVDRRMRRLLEDFGVAPAQLPAADMYETEKELIVELEVPGFDEKELSLEASDHVLTIKGERIEEKEEEEKTFFLHERLEKHFERSLTMPIEADLDRVAATFRAGVLEVHVPKIEPAKARKIEIEA